MTQLKNPLKFLIVISIIYRGNFDGDINKSFTFDEHIASIISTDNQFWVFTGTSLIKYPLTKFTN